MRCLPIEGLYAIHFCVSCFHYWFSVPTLIFSPFSLEEAHVAPPSKGFSTLATAEYTNYPFSPYFLHPTSIDRWNENHRAFEIPGMRLQILECQI